MARRMTYGNKAGFYPTVQDPVPGQAYGSNFGEVLLNTVTDDQNVSTTTAVMQKWITPAAGGKTRVFFEMSANTQIAVG